MIETASSTSNLGQQLAGLSPAQRALLELRLMQKNGRAKPARARIKRQANRKSGPLSYHQQGLWLLNQLTPGESLYHTSTAMRLTGTLNGDALKKALQSIVDRHESLRTIFKTIDGTPAQIVEEFSLELPLIDLRESSESDREAEALRILRDEAHRPFDLSQGPLTRAVLVRLHEREHILLVTMHHIVTDGWSIGIVHRELSKLYEAFMSGKPAPLPELPIQYTDYSAWQRDSFDGEIYDSQLAYWKQQFATLPPALELPADHPRAKTQAHRVFRGAQQTITLPVDLTRRIRMLCQQEKVTLFMMLMAAYQILLHRYTGEEDIVVGTPIAGRQVPETEDLIGLFINTLAMRTPLSGDATFRDILNRVKQVALGAYAHQDLPFDRLVKELQPERTLAHNPLFQVMLVLQSEETLSLQLPGLEAQHYRVGNFMVDFDLTLDVVKRDEQLVCLFESNADLFEPDTILRMMGHFQSVLEAIVNNPEQMISSLPLLTEAERLESLPLSPMGKIDQRALPPNEFKREAEKGFAAPSNELELKLAKIWEEVLNVRPIGTDENFFELGGHSLMAVRLFARVEKAFGRNLPLATLFQAPTVKQLARVLHDEGWRAAWSSLVMIQPGSAHTPFFCVHAAGGNVLEYHDLARLLGPDQPFYGFQSRGLDVQSESHTNIKEMAAHYLKEMREIQPEGPYLLGGRSSGGTIAFEMACQLEAIGEKVALLALLDTYPAGYFKLLPGSASLGQCLGRRAKKWQTHLLNLRALTIGDKVRYLLNKLHYAPAKAKHKIYRRAYKLYKKFGRPLPPVLQNIEEINFVAVKDYEPQVYSGDATLFLASDLTSDYDLHDGWKELVRGNIEAHEIPGDHINMIKEPHVGALAEKLRECIERTQKKIKAA